MKKKIHIDYPLKVKKYTKAHLDYLINSKAEESIHIEFKAGMALANADQKKKEISKDISAFANSDGGIIIYGIAEENHVASHYSFVDGRVHSKEWLEQIINSKIKRRIPDLQIDVIRINNKISQSIYVVKVPRSNEAPHMASDGRYFKRYNFESVRMEEYEVRDLFSRTEETKLQLEPVDFSTQITKNKAGKVKQVKMSVVLDVKNVSSAIEQVYKTIIRIPRKVYDDSKDHGLEPYFRKYQPDYALLNLPGHTPLFPNEVNTIANFQLQILKKHLPELSRFPLKIRFYYSNGIYERENFLDLQIKEGGKLHTAEDFVG